MNNVCVKCGERLAAGASFCGSCGHHVELVEPVLSDSSEKKVSDVAMIVMVVVAVLMPLAGLIMGIWGLLSGRKKQGKIILWVSGIVFLLYVFLAA